MCQTPPLGHCLSPGPQTLLFTSHVTVCAEKHSVQGVLTEAGTYYLVLQHP